MIKEKKITDFKEITDLVNSGQIDLRAFLDLPLTENTNNVVEEFLKKGYSIEVYGKKEKSLIYGISRPFSKAAIDLAGIDS